MDYKKCYPKIEAAHLGDHAPQGFFVTLYWQSRPYSSGGYGYIKIGGMLSFYVINKFRLYHTSLASL
jgi:hypothetical protein